MLCETAHNTITCSCAVRIKLILRQAFQCHSMQCGKLYCIARPSVTTRGSGSHTALAVIVIISQFGVIFCFVVLAFVARLPVRALAEGRFTTSVLLRMQARRSSLRQLEARAR